MPRKYIDVTAMNAQEFLSYTKRDKLAGLATVDPNRDILSIAALGAVVNSGEFTTQQRDEYYDRLGNSLPMKNGKVDVNKLGSIVNEGNASEYQQAEWQKIQDKAMTPAKMEIKTDDSFAQAANSLPMKNGKVDVNKLGSIVNEGNASEYQKAEWKKIQDKAMTPAKMETKTDDSFAQVANSLPMKNGEVDVNKLGGMVNSGEASEYQQAEWQKIQDELMRKR